MVRSVYPMGVAKSVPKSLALKQVIYSDLLETSCRQGEHEVLGKMQKVSWLCAS